MYTPSARIVADASEIKYEKDTAGRTIGVVNGPATGARLPDYAATRQLTV